MILLVIQQLYCAKELILFLYIKDLIRKAHLLGYLHFIGPNNKSDSPETVSRLIIQQFC